MRIKSLPVIIASFLVSSLAITSCLDSDNNYELSSDDWITAFSLDTIYGVTYKFTIDQINGHIYNVDSVAYGADTVINKILITTLTTNGYVTAGPDVESFLQDTLFNYTDSIDFTEPLDIRVRSFDGSSIKRYHIEVRIHQADPDTLVWGNHPYVENFSGITATESKAVLLGDDILVYMSDGTDIKVYKGSSQFSEVSPAALPANMKIRSILNVKETLYGVTEDEKVFGSTDGATWTEVTNNAKVVNLITSFNDTIAGIIKGNTAELFAIATVNADGLKWETDSIAVPNENNYRFPTNFVATKSFTTPTGGQQALLIGEPAENSQVATYPWFSNDGLNWGQMEPSKGKYALPVMEEPSILYYGNTIYAFGKKEAEGFSYIYRSVNGIVWEKIEKKFMFPWSNGESVFKDRSGYAMVVDKDNYIRMFWNKEDEVWRGKLNRLGFKIQ